MLQKDFKPVLRFLAVSDIHFPDEEDSKEHKYFKRALELAYKIAESHETYKRIDAVYVVGDFATSGSRTQMLSFKAALDNGLKPETERTLMMASHEFHGEGGEEGALERFSEIFNMPPDDHKVINGFHFISLTTTNGCNFSDEKVNWAKEQLKKARADGKKKPIFFFQHPHISGTVYGSINWGEDALYPVLAAFPQVIDFSGHSHAPINDPRSVHQKHFTSFGTGSFRYFELDEFDKIYGTVPPHSERCAQFLIVEADENGRVRVYPYDVITENFFPYTWEVDEPWNPDSFKYTDERYKTAVAPYFDSDFEITFSDVTENGFKVTFPQAKIERDYVDDYLIRVREEETGLIATQAAIWSEYYFYDMPKTLSHTFSELEPDTEYTVEIIAGSFWKTKTASNKFKIKTLNYQR